MSTKLEELSAYLNILWKKVFFPRIFLTDDVFFPIDFKMALLLQNKKYN